MERIHVKVPGEQPQDREYMKQALALAENGHGWVNPNPMVGAVLVKDGRIIGEGYHTRDMDSFMQNGRHLRMRQSGAKRRREQICM